MLARTFPREFRLIFSNPTGVFLGFVPPLVYALCFLTSMSSVAGEVRTGGGAVGYAEFALSGVLVMSVVAGASQSGGLIFGEQASGMLSEVFSAPVSRAGFLLGRLGCSSLVVVAQSCVLLLVSALVLKSSTLLVRLPAILLTLAFVAVCMNLLFLAAATLIRSQQVFLIAANVGATVLIFVAPSWYPYQAMPTVLQAFSWANPVTYCLALLRFASSGQGGSMVAVSGLVLALIALVAGIGTLRVLRRRIAEG